jgi:hypothetical protein
MPILALLIAAASAQPGPAPPENLLRGPARCVLRYLDAIRLSGPHAPAARSTAALAARELDYERARVLTAPRALEVADRAVSRGEDHPLAPWRQAARGTVLESFQLLAVRRAPLGAAVVTVRERWWRARAAAAPLDGSVSEYLVARVDGTWRVVDRRPGAAFDDETVASDYAGWFDEPASVEGGRAARAARGAPIPARTSAPLRPPSRR